MATSPTASTPAAIIHQTQSSILSRSYGQGLVHVGEEVFGRLAAGAQADEPLGHVVARPSGYAAPRW